MLILHIWVANILLDACMVKTVGQLKLYKMLLLHHTFFKSYNGKSSWEAQIAKDAFVVLHI